MSKTVKHVSLGVCRKPWLVPGTLLLAWHDVHSNAGFRRVLTNAEVNKVPRRPTLVCGHGAASPTGTGFLRTHVEVRTALAAQAGSEQRTLGPETRPAHCPDAAPVESQLRRTRSRGLLTPSSLVHIFRPFLNHSETAKAQNTTDVAGTNARRAASGLFILSDQSAQGL